MLTPDCILAGRANWRYLMWFSTGNLYEILQKLFNAGYRGNDLKPPKGWKRTDLKSN